MQRNVLKTILTLLMLVILAACSFGNPGPTAAPTPIPSDTPIPTPTFTATPSSPLAILVLPADMDQESYNKYQTVVYDLAQQTGFRFQVRNTLSEADLEPALRIVIALPPDPGIISLAAVAPQTQFLAIGIPDIAPSANVSVLADNAQADVIAFMAGYIGAMITEDYRIGMLYPKDNPDALSALDAFTNGMTFYCGQCQGFYYLPYTFPQNLEVPADEDPSRYSAYAEYLISQRNVDFLYVYPDLANPDFLSYIGNAGATQIGTSTMEPKPLYWVATIRPDVVSAIQSAWPSLIAGQGGQTIQSPLGFADVNSDLFTPGKQADAEQVLADLLAGRIAIHSIQ